jgi:hypothetical protein
LLVVDFFRTSDLVVVHFFLGLAGTGHRVISSV